MTNQERRAGLFLICLGLASAYYGMFALRIGTISQPGPGAFPFISGAGIVILCLVWIVANPVPAGKSQPLWSKGQLVRPVVATAAITAYAWLMEPLGYVLSTFAFLVGWQVFVEGEKWRKTTAVAVVGTAAMYLLFVRLLSLALPEGLLEYILY
jgi:hypothetical protein